MGCECLRCEGVDGEEGVVESRQLQQQCCSKER